MGTPGEDGSMTSYKLLEFYSWRGVYEKGQFKTNFINHGRLLESR